MEIKSIDTGLNNVSNENQFEVKLIITTKNINPNKKIDLKELTNKILRSALEFAREYPYETLSGTEEGLAYYENAKIEDKDIDFNAVISSISQCTNHRIENYPVSDHNIVDNIKLTIF